MPSERIQRRIERLLDEAEAAADAEDWGLVRRKAAEVLGLHPENEDAPALSRAADNVLGVANSGGLLDEPAEPPVAESVQESRFLPESFVDGRYQVRDFLGEGGRKQVYLAHDIRLDRDVAFAVIKTEGLDANGRQRIQREAEAMGRLSGHPHIVTIYDVGEEDGQPYIVSEYMAGGDVEAIIAAADDHQLDLARAVAIADQVAQALEHAHADGIVHRDLKPGNIWLAEDGTAKLGDFGLAFAASDTRMTTEGTMLGTVAYMPPEQALGGGATPQSDLYSLGCALYEMVTGRPPFVGDDAVAVISQHLNTTPVAPSLHRADCASGLETLIETLLAKTPADRPASAGEVRTQITAIDLTIPAASSEHPNPLERLARGVFVGRERELGMVRSAIDEALAGRGQVLLLVGDPGIGKTRLALESETYARMRGASVVWGTCHESGIAMPYRPWTRLLRNYVARLDDEELRADLGASGPEVAQLVPDVRARLPDLPDVPVATGREALQEAVLQFYDGVSHLIERGAERRPLVLTLDDLHWADQGTLQLLQHVAREISRSRVLILGTYRDTDLDRSHPLAGALAEMNREGLITRVALQDLTRDEVADYVRGAIGRDPDPAIVAQLHGETEGNPFFLQQVVALMIQERGFDGTALRAPSIPEGVREALGRRLDRLSDACNATMRLAAVVGREFRHSLLQRASGLEDDELLTLVEEALDAHVVEEHEEPGSYRFTHALMQDTLLDEMSAARRVREHARVAEALEAASAPDVGALAEHFTEAAVLGGSFAQRAARYSYDAAREAFSTHALGVARRHFEQTLNLMEDADNAIDLDEAAVLVELAECLLLEGDWDQHVTLLDRAIEIYRERGDTEHFVRTAVARLDLGGAYDDVALRAEVVAAAEGASPYLLALALQPGVVEFSPDADARADRADALAREHDFPDVSAAIANRAAHRPLNEYRWRDVPPLLDAALAAYERTDNFFHIGHLISDYAEAAGHAGDLEAWERAAEDTQRHADEQRFTTWLERSSIYGACIPALRGDLALASERASGGSGPGLQLVAAILALWRGDAGEALRRAEAAHAAFQQARKPQAMGLIAGILLCGGDEVGARTAFDEWLGGLRASEFSLLVTAALGCAVHAFGLASAEQVEEIYGRATESTTTRLAMVVPVALDPICAELALRLGRFDEARAHLATGLAWAEREQAPLAIAQCERGLAELARTEGDRPAALRHAQRAIALYAEMGLPFLAEAPLALKVALEGQLAAIDVTTSIDAIAASLDTERPDLTPQAAPDGTVTLLFSDIENSTARTTELGDVKWMELLREHRAIVRDQLAAHGGYEVKSMGDGFMLAFGSALDGLRCAIGMQRAFAERNAKADEPLRVRIGLHTGEAIKEADDFFGTHVNLAARIAGGAQGDEILVSGLLKALTDSAGEFTFDDEREVELKGIRGPQRVHAVEWH